MPSFCILRFLLPHLFAAIAVILSLSSPLLYGLLFLSPFILFSRVFSLLHTASQKHLLKPMHESHLAHLKWSKV